MKRLDHASKNPRVVELNDSDEDEKGETAESRGLEPLVRRDFAWWVSLPRQCQSRVWLRQDRRADADLVAKRVVFRHEVYERDNTLEGIQSIREHWVVYARDCLDATTISETNPHRAPGWWEPHEVSVPSAPSRDITSLGRTPDGLRAARAEISAGITDAEAVLLGFGIVATSGDGKQHLRTQLKWLRTELSLAGHARVWQVGERPRHPSRWHQYLSNLHGRTAGGDLEQRLEDALRSVSLDDVVWSA